MKSEPESNKHVENGIDALISPFFKTDWKPAPYRQLIQEEHKQALHDSGYLVLKQFFSSHTVGKLNKLFGEHQHIGVNEIGMFMSAYSKDIVYRKEVHRRMGVIIEPELNSIFTAFKPVIYNFVIKESRPEHALPVHQDLALLDENLASPINIWTCMVDTDINNGPVCLRPKTQYFFPLHQSKNSDAVPIVLETGDLLGVNSSKSGIMIWRN